MICLICALDNELKALKKHLECVKEIKILNKNVYVGKVGFKDIAFVKSGIGKAAAAATTALMIKEFNPELVVTTGIAGAFDERLKPLDIIVAVNTFYYDVDMTCDIGESFRYGEIQDAPFPFTASKKALEVLMQLDDGTFKYGSIVTADIFQNKRDGLEKLQKEEFSDFDILAVDMESAAIMHISTIFNTASVAIRAVSDVIGMPSQITNFYQYTKKASEEISSIVEKFVSKL